jgi:hypothetical protein
MSLRGGVTVKHLSMVVAQAHPGMFNVCRDLAIDSLHTNRLIKGE